MRVIPEHPRAPVSVAGDHVHVEEAWTYRVSPDQDEDWIEATARFGDRPLRRCATDVGFVLEVPHMVGAADLVVQVGAETITQRVVVEPRREKVCEEAWLALLSDLDRWAPGSTIGREEGRHGSIERQGTSLAAIAEALTPLVAPLVQAFRAIQVAPRLRQIRVVHEVPPHRVRRIDAGLVRHVTGNVAAAQTAGVVSGAAVAEARFPQPRQRTDLEHPANRYVVWAMWRVARRLNELADWYRSAAESQEERAWWATRATRLAGAAEQVELAVRRSPLRTVRRAPPTQAALLSILDDPAYARFHRIARWFLAPRFSLEPSEASIGAAVRPSFELYEYWCFEAVARALVRELPGWTRQTTATDSNDDLLGLARRRTHRFDRPGGGRLELMFNVTFRSRPTGAPFRHSITRERRPDLVATWSPPNGPSTWTALDAKYRVARGGLLDAFSSCHVYRDSLRWPNHGGPPRGCVLLTPARTADTAAWFERQFIEDNGLGAIRLTPGTGESTRADAAHWVLESLGIAAE